MSLLQTLTRPSLKNKPTEKLCGGSGHSWVGHIFLIWTLTTSSTEDNPFAGPKLQPAGKMSVCMPPDDWLCNKLKKLNLTLVEG